jgi:hypothetical protein
MYGKIKYQLLMCFEKTDSRRDRENKQRQWERFAGLWMLDRQRDHAWPYEKGNSDGFNTIQSLVWSAGLHGMNARWLEYCIKDCINFKTKMRLREDSDVLRRTTVFRFQWSTKILSHEEKVCFWSIFGRWIQICFQNFSITHTFRVASDYVKAQAYIHVCESQGDCKR